MFLAGGFATSAQAQVAQSSLVSVCSGVQLPASAVTNIIDPVVTGVVSPIQTNINSTLGALRLLPGLLGLPGNLSIDAATLLTTAADGAPVTLRVLAADGTIVGPTAQCNAAADGYTLDTEAGVAIGGNIISGLGVAGEEADAGEINSIAIGNRATTDGTAENAIAIGRAATVLADADGSVALGSGASAAAPNSVALGAGSVAARGNEVSVGAPGTERVISNVAAGTAPTDAATLGQLQAVAAAIPQNAVSYDGATRDVVTLAGADGTTLTNVAAGEVAIGSTDAVNGGQLFALQQQTDANTTAITNLALSIATGSVGPVQYSNPGTPTVPNGGVPTNDVTLTGAAPGAVGLHNVANGVIAAGSTDAVNGGQVFALVNGATNSVQYEVDGDGNRTNNVQLAGGDPAAPVTISNVAAGELSATSTQAVNGSQLNATNQAVAAAQGTADVAQALAGNSVQYDSAARTAVTFGPSTGAVVLRNVAAGTAATDAVNVGQLNGALQAANAYTDSRLAALDFNLRDTERGARAGSAAALAAAGMPQAIEPGKGMVAMGFGTYRGRQAVAFGASKITNDGRAAFKLGITYDASSKVGANGGVGIQF